MVIVGGSVRQLFRDENQDEFHLVRSVGCVINSYDFTFKEDSKCDAKARNNVRVYDIEESVITELLNTNAEFKMLWYKSMFIYCYHLHKGLKETQGIISDRDVRALADRSDICHLGANQTFNIRVGAFVYAGQVAT